MLFMRFANKKPASKADDYHLRNLTGAKLQLIRAICDTLILNAELTSGYLAFVIGEVPKMKAWEIVSWLGWKIVIVPVQF